MRIYSWNINGIRAAAKKGFGEWLAESESFLVGVQEVRALREQMSDEIAEPEGWHSRFVAAERKGYSGVGAFSAQAPDEHVAQLGMDKYDIEGRYQLLRIGKLQVANVYFPNGNGKDRDNSRVPYKLGFYKRVYNTLNKNKLAGDRILVMGDFNTAHEAIDLARPKSNKKTSGFLQEERDEISRWIRGGWVDTFRHFHADEPDHYSWWSQRMGARQRNVGWRIDYIMASPGAIPFVKGAHIHPQTMGSDHCPISVDLDPAILE